MGDVQVVYGVECWKNIYHCICWGENSIQRGLGKKFLMVGPYLNLFYSCISDCISKLPGITPGIIGDL